MRESVLYTPCDNHDDVHIHVRGRILHSDWCPRCESIIDCDMCEVWLVPDAIEADPHPPLTNFTFYTTHQGPPVTTFDTPPVDIPTDQRVVNLTHEVEMLTTNLQNTEQELIETRMQYVDRGNTIDALRTQLNCAQENHREDIERISDRLIEEANDRGWCDTYDQIINQINRNLHVPLRRRERSYCVTQTIELTVTKYLTAVDEDQAERDAGELEGFSSFVERQGWSYDGVNVRTTTEQDDD